MPRQFSYQVIELVGGSGPATGFVRIDRFLHQPTLQALGDDYQLGIDLEKNNFAGFSPGTVGFILLMGASQLEPIEGSANSNTFTQNILTPIPVGFLLRFSWAALSSLTIRVGGITYSPWVDFTTSGPG